MPPREKGAKACLQDWAGHFLRSALRERFAQLRPIRAISQELRAVFSARQTLWRRERHSNPRYNFERARADVSVTCTESTTSENPITARLPRSHAKQCASSPLCKGEWLAILCRKVVTSECRSRPGWLAPDSRHRESRVSSSLTGNGREGAVVGSKESKMRRAGWRTCGAGGVVFCAHVASVSRLQRYSALVPDLGRNLERLLFHKGIQVLQPGPKGQARCLRPALGQVHPRGRVHHRPGDGFDRSPHRVVRPPRARRSVAVVLRLAAAAAWLVRHLRGGVHSLAHPQL